MTAWLHIDRPTSTGSGSASQPLDFHNRSLVGSETGNRTLASGQNPLSAVP